MFWKLVSWYLALCSLKNYHFRISDLEMLLQMKTDDNLIIILAVSHDWKALLSYRISMHLNLWCIVVYVMLLRVLYFIIYHSRWSGSCKAYTICFTNRPAKAHSKFPGREQPAGKVFVEIKENITSEVYNINSSI